MPFAWVLGALAPLLKKWETWVVLTLLVVLLYVLSLQRQLAAANAALAARPTVSDTAKTATDFHEEKGKVTIVERFLPAPAATVACPNPKLQLAERDTIREPSVIDRKTESENAHTEAPACPAALPAPWRYAGAVVDPFAPTKLVGLRGGVTLYNRVDLGVSARTQPNTITGDVGIRF